MSINLVKINVILMQYTFQRDQHLPCLAIFKIQR